PNRPMGNPKDGDKDNPCHGNPCGTLTKDHEHERPYEVKLLLNGERPEVLGENGIAGEVAYECNALQRIAPHEAVYQRSKEKQNHSLIGPRARPEAEDATQVETAQGNASVIHLAQQIAGNQIPAENEEDRYSEASPVAAPWMSGSPKVRFENHENS